MVNESGQVVPATDVVDYDAELDLHHPFLRRAYGIRRTDRVVDIGCGTGLTTREAARLASDGTALGVDVSHAMIEEARSRAAAEGLANVRYEVGDAQVYPLGQATFDVAISRFGTMFFDDPQAAFANIGRSLGTNGRIVMLVWQAYDRNEWAVSIDRALGADTVGGDRSSKDVVPFSLGDPSLVERVLGTAGFEDVTLADVHVPVYYGPDPNAALAFVSRFTDVRRRLTGGAADVQRDARERLRMLMTEHDTGRGVWFDSRSWLVTARRA
jgi:SAM-dependent methyltransferase